MKKYYEIKGQLETPRKETSDNLDACTGLQKILMDNTNCYGVERDGTNLEFDFKKNVFLPAKCILETQVSSGRISIRYSIDYEYLFRFFQVAALFFVATMMPESLANIDMTSVILKVAMVGLIFPGLFYLAARDSETKSLLKYVENKYANDAV